jgi:hypothetical protein
MMNKEQNMGKEQKTEPSTAPETGATFALPLGTPGISGSGTGAATGQRGRPGRRFRNRTDVLIAIESIIQLGLLKYLAPIDVRTYVSALRSIAALLPEENAGAVSAPLSEDLRTRLAADPVMVDLLSGLLTPQQLEDLMKSPTAADTDR